MEEPAPNHPGDNIKPQTTEQSSEEKPRHSEGEEETTIPQCQEEGEQRSASAALGANEDNKVPVSDPSASVYGVFLEEEEPRSASLGLGPGEMDSPQLVGSPPAFPSAEEPQETQEANKVFALVAATTVATSAVAEMAVDTEKSPPSESEESGIPQCEEDGEQQLAEEDEKAPTFEPLDTIAAGNEAMQEEAEEMAVDAVETSKVASRRGGRRRKRGRLSTAQGVRARAPAKPKEDEDLCFICFDGGDLVVCDHRGCPKVYHPSCVNRDEAYFRAKGRWNCGWHICSNCQKSARYMCYTCTYSLCKGCIKEAEFACVRGNKGFCETCMKTVMLIETNEHADEKMVGVDFDDKSSWLYLFKDYWLDLKAKLSLTVEELMRARTPSKGSNVVSHNEESLDILDDASDDQGASSSSSSGCCKESISSRKKVKKRPRSTTNKEGSVKEAEVEGTSIPEYIEWASRDLLEFVAHMKNGDRPVLSQFDVQALLLEYIKRNNLRDPRKKSQIVCDSRLRTLFGKSRVGHLEMLKLLESHFLIKEASPLATDDNQGGVVDPDPSQMDAEGNSDASTKMTSDRRWKACRRIEKKEMANLDDYAAIDVHNINLMYLRRNLMEELLDDIDMFNENVVGSFVRIRISGSGQKQDMYRLVQVVGTGKTTEKYKTGKRATDVTLEILNLNKREIITIDIISNQEFTEEECKRLRQSVKCGFIGRLTVGEVQEKARALQVVRVTDWLESEKLRLGHLRDRASEKGRRKELRECVEKLQLLSTPEERMRRLNEVPEIHSDPNMDPDYESAEDEEDLDAKKQDNGNQPWESSFKGRDVHSLGKGGPAAWKNSDITWQSNRSTSKGVQDVELSTAVAERTNELFGDQGKVVRQISSPETPKTEANTTGMDAGDRNNNQPMTKPGLSSGVPSETTPGSMSTNFVATSNTSETEKMWHYQDPSGKIQGPFSMAQLRKWNTTGYFPANLRIWRISEKQEDSILLTDALIGKFHKDLPRQEPQQNSTTQLTKVAAKMGTRGNNLDGGWRENNNCQIEASFPNTGSNNLTKANRWTTPSSLSATNTGVVNPVDGRPATSLRGWEASKDTNAWSGQPQVHNSPRPITPFSRYSSQPPSFQGRDGRGNTGRWNGDRGRQNNWNSNKPRRFQPTGRGYERQHPYQSSSSQQFPGEQWKVQPANDSSNQLGNNSSFNLPAHTPQPSSIDWTSLQGALNKILPPASSVQPLTSGLSTTPRGNEAQQSLSTTKDSNKTSTMNSVGGWASSSVPNVTSVQIQEKVDVLTNFQTSNQQNKPSETAASIIFENQLVFSGSNSTEFMGGLDRKQWLESDHPNPTKCEQAAAAVLNSDCSQPAQSQLSETGDHTVALCHELDTDKNCPEAHDRSASESKKICVDGKGLGPASVAPALGSSNLPDALESVSAQRSEASSSPKPQSASQCWAPVSAQQQGPDGSNVNPAQPLNMGWGMVLQNPNPGTGTAQEIGNMVYRTAIQGNANMGWGMVAQGVMDVAWGTPANLNMGWGQPAQATANASLGLAIPAQENANMNLAWGAPAQGNTNPNAGWGAPMQVTSALNPGWLVPALGNTNPNPGWVAPTEGNTNQNASCGTPMQGTGQGIMNSMSMAWNPSGGNPSSWNAQQEQAGDGHSGQGDGVFHSSGSGRAKSGAGGGLSRPTPPPGGQRGVCKFHENGHCKKGASCNYIHS